MELRWGYYLCSFRYLTLHQCLPFPSGCKSEFHLAFCLGGEDNFRDYHFPFPTIRPLTLQANKPMWTLWPLPKISLSWQSGTSMDKWNNVSQTCTKHSIYYFASISLHSNVCVGGGGSLIMKVVWYQCQYRPCEQQSKWLGIPLSWVDSYPQNRFYTKTYKQELYWGVLSKLMPVEE